jgi:NADPH:quinone reductase-like Zn-dependent oxidoreductase
VTRNSWDSYLKTSGFTGLDLAFPACDETTTCIAMVSTVEPSQNTHKPKAIIMVLANSPIQQKAAEQLIISLRDICSTCEIVSVEEIKNTNSDDVICVSLLEIHNSFFSQISEANFEALKDLFSRFRSIFWATSEISSAASPLTDMITGLARSLREENDDLKLVTVKLQTIQDLTQTMDQFSKIVGKAVQSPMNDKEIEFADVNGAICVGRLVELDGLNDFVARKTIPQGAEMRRLRDGISKPIKLAIRNPGLLSTFQYEVDTSSLCKPLGADQIDIEVKATGLNFRDVLIALGKEPACYIGMECSGVVLAVGCNAAAKFKSGDRVACMIDGSFRTIARCVYQVAIKIPEDMSFISAAAFPIAYCSAYYAIMHVGRLKRKESILIHSGAGAFGQACIQLAKLLDANIFTTVGTDEKKQFLIDTYQINKENIFSSRGPHFVHGIKALTAGKGVDVVVNSLAGEALRRSWDCIAPFGRFVEAGKKDIYNFGKLPMFPFSRNATFSSIDMFYNYHNAPELIEEVMEASMALLKDGKITLPSPIHIYNSSQFEAAFRYLESGKSTGKLVIEFQDDDMLPVCS